MNVDDHFDEAISDSRRGAAEIERRLIASLLDHRRLWTPESLRAGAARLVAAQPAMANLRRLANLLVDDDLRRVGEGLRRRVQILDQLDASLGRHGPGLLGGRKRVVTISRSSAVRAVLKGGFDGGWRGEVVVLDGTAAGCGADQAESLRAAGFAAASLPDGAVCVALDEPVGQVLVLVGADAVGTTRFVNVQGTRALCELARARGIGVVLIADSGKDLGDGDIDDVLASAPVYRERAPKRQWPVFEGVPLALVNERLDERGRVGSGGSLC